MSIRIGIGAGLNVPLAVDTYWRWVALCESSGIDSVWHSDQLLRPSLEPTIMLTALAVATKRLRFGMNAMVISHRDPLVIAKQCATIDYLSPGRLLPVFGVGDASDPAWEATGRSTKGRGKRANEAIDLVRRLLTEDSVTFQGEYFQYREARVEPRPVKPLPIWIGGSSEAAIRRTAALGDGWLGGLTSSIVASDVIVRIKQGLLETGRRIEEDHYGVVLPFRIGTGDDPEVVRFRNLLAARRGTSDSEFSGAIAAGDTASVIDAFRQYVDAGVAKFVAIPLSNSDEDLFIQTQRLAEEILPAIEDR
jgi:probable F420-dependent oxidoreductase